MPVPEEEGRADQGLLAAALGEGRDRAPGLGADPALLSLPSWSCRCYCSRWSLVLPSSWGSGEMASCLPGRQAG